MTLTYLEAGSACNSGTTDNIRIDLQIPASVWTAAAAFTTLDSDCRPVGVPFTAIATGTAGVCE